MRMKYYHLEDPIKYDRVMVEKRKKCKCGHRINFPPNMDKIVCSWCGNYVFRDKKTEFEYRINQEMRRNNGK